MDPWNPWLDEKYVKETPLWQTVLGFFVSVCAVIGAAWIVALLLFTLERAYG